MASISLDVDDLWSYLKTHGDPDWISRPSYLDRFIPCAVEAMERNRVTCTFFIVGTDAERMAGTSLLRTLTEAGHSVGNHSHEHEPWLHLYSDSQLDTEVTRAEQAIVAATGQRPKGFRGPGFSWSPALLGLLETKGYRYDASTFPTFLGPLARAYYFWTARLSREERKQRKALFGSLGEGFRPNRPYRWGLPGGRGLLEIPVTTLPVLRVPFHLSYLLYLSRWSERAMLLYLRTALRACRLAGVEPSFLLHPLDLLGGDEVPQLSFFPGMDLTGAEKTAHFDRVMAALKRSFTVVDLDTHAASILQRGQLRTVRTLAAKPVPQGV
jgi:hypothetical protein